MTIIGTGERLEYCYRIDMGFVNGAGLCRGLWFMSTAFVSFLEGYPVHWTWNWNWDRIALEASIDSTWQSIHSVISDLSRLSHRFFARMFSLLLYGLQLLITL